MPLLKQELGAVAILVGSGAAILRLILIRDLLDQLYCELSKAFHVELCLVLSVPWRWKLMQLIHHSLLKDHDETLITAF